MYGFAPVRLGERRQLDRVVGYKDRLYQVRFDHLGEDLVDQARPARDSLDVYVEFFRRLAELIL